MAQIRFGRHKINIPDSQLVRMALGVILILGGLVGFLPVVGFWMLPLGMLVLSYDFPLVRRWRRRMEVVLGRWYKRLKTWWRKR
ncbi:MAG: hypothetical protein H3C28_14980 [Sphingomonadales bacterium]|nr:hypothetical protein [Sphingomonadales bacterium]